LLSEIALVKYQADMCKKDQGSFAQFSYSPREARSMVFLFCPVRVKHADRPTATRVVPASKENLPKKTLFAPNAGKVRG
jgi:hypothetical protein